MGGLRRGDIRVGSKVIPEVCTFHNDRRLNPFVTNAFLFKNSLPLCKFEYFEIYVRFSPVLNWNIRNVADAPSPDEFP